MRAELDQHLVEAVDGLLRVAATYDNLDMIEANVEMTNFLIDRFGPAKLAASAASLALHAHRAGARRG